MHKDDVAITDSHQSAGLCYFLVCFKSQEYVAYLLASLFRENDLFIVHCDLKAPEDLKSYLRSLSNSYENIIVMESQPYSWAGFSHVDVCLKAAAFALAQSCSWSHLIFLSEQHLPLKSPYEIASYLTGRKSIVAIRPATSMGGNERSDIENRFSGRYRELPGVGCFVIGLTPRDELFYKDIFHGSNWMILCREHCKVIDCADREGHFGPFKEVVHSEETAIPSVLRHHLSEIECRDGVLVANPDITDNHDLVMTEDLFRSHISTDFLFIRKRPAVISSFVDDFIVANNFDESIYRHKPDRAEERLEVDDKISGIVYNFCMHVLRRFDEQLSVQMIDRNTHGSVPTFYAIIRHSSMRADISVRVVSEDARNFKVLIAQDDAFTGVFESQKQFHGFIQSTIRSRIYDLFGNLEFLPESSNNSGFVSISDDRSVGMVSEIAAEFVEQAIALSRLINLKPVAAKAFENNGDIMRAQRLNALARICGAKRYLEVGVCKGDTFFEVDVPYKVAVDPNFLFDYNSRASKNVVFSPVASDEFFESSHEAPFDLIYLDGLHTYEQTTRDFINSLRFAHDKTIWVLDDTVPHDVFSAIPDQQKCYELRHKLAQGDWFWMGDVYKTVFFIERMFPFFQFKTYNGHGQTVFWKTNTSRDLSLNKIGLDRVGVMGYEDFIDNIDVMRIAEETEILGSVGEAFKF